MADLRSSCARVFNTIHAGLTIDIHSARTAPEMPHLYLSGRDNDLAITQRSDIVPVDTQAEWSWAARVRRVKSSQPRRRAGIRFVLSVRHAAPRKLSACLSERLEENQWRDMPAHEFGK